MGEIVGAAIVFGIAVVMAWHSWRRRDESPLFILRLLPATLLVVSLPALLAAIDLFRGLERLADGDPRGAPQGTLGGNVATALVLGLMGMLVAASIAAALQAFATGVAEPSDAPAPPVARADTWLLIAPTLAVLPITFVVVTMRGLAILLAHVERLGPDDDVMSMVGMPVDQLSLFVSRRLTQVVIAGGAANLALLVLTPALLFLARSRRPRGALDVYSWLVVALLLGVGSWGAYTIAGDLRGVHALPLPR